MGVEEKDKNMGKIIENNLKVSIDKVKPNNFNPKLNFREYPDLGKEFNRIKKSLKTYGQLDPIQVRELDDGTFELINGYHRWEAMKELGFVEIEIKNLGKISREQAIKIAISTEDTKIPLEQIEVAKLLKEIRDSEIGLEGLPYEIEDIEAKINLLEFDWKQDNDKSKKITTGVLSIWVTEGQRDIIVRAIKSITEKENVGQGRALELICADFLAK